MNAGLFVDLLRRYVVESAAQDTLSQVENPTGRFPSEEREQRSEWLKNLSAADRTMVEYIAAEAARSSAFGVLCVLDGSRVIENEPDRGRFQLHHIFGDTDTLLASSVGDAPPLHELL